MRQITVEELLKMGNGTKVRIEYDEPYDWNPFEFHPCNIESNVYVLKYDTLENEKNQNILCRFRWTNQDVKSYIDACVSGKILGLYLIERKEDETIDLDEYKKHRFERAMEYRKTLDKKTQKATLKDGDIVALRNGDEYLYKANSGKMLLAISQQAFIQVTSLDVYNDDLTSRDREQYDIVKIEHEINKKTRSVEVRDSEKQLMYIEKVNNENLWQVFTNGNHKAITLTNNHIKYLHKKLGEIVEQMKGDE